MTTQHSNAALRSWEQNVAIFQQLEDYAWDSDSEFQSGLQAILGPNPSTEQAEHLTLHARCFYFARYGTMYTCIDVTLRAEASICSAKAASPSTSMPTKHGGLSNLSLLPMAWQSWPQRLILPSRALVLRDLIQPLAVA